MTQPRDDPHADTGVPPAACPQSPETTDEVTLHLAPPLNASPAVPGYELLGELGRGGMGVVYRARQIKANRVVALKMILSGAHAGFDELVRFQTEAHAIARLQHPNIVQVHDVGEHEGCPFFSLEFCSRGSLENKLSGTPLQPVEAAQLVELLARAMHAAHQKGIIHRDLKPANVLLAEDGTPKITDFELAKKIDEAGQTASGAIVGTPSYMAPEQACGHSRELGPLCDVYALGAILYEGLTGRPPFRAAGVIETLRQVVHDEPVAPRQLQSGVPRDLETICLKALAKDPGRRYSSAEALADDLRRFQESRPIVARPVGPLGRLARWYRRDPWYASATTLAALCLFVLTAGALFFALVQRDAAETQRLLNADVSAKADEINAKAEVIGKQVEKEKQLNAEVKKKANDLGKALETSEAALRTSARMARRQGLTLCEQGDVGQGLHLLARSLELSPARDAGFQRTLRTELAEWRSELTALRNVFSQAEPITEMRFGAGGDRIVLGGSAPTEETWLIDAATGRPSGVPIVVTFPVVGRSFSPDGKTLLLLGDRQAELWDTASGQRRGDPMAHEAAINCTAISPDGALLATASDLKVRLWETATGRPIGEPLQHPSPVRDLAFNHSGKALLTHCSHAKISGPRLVVRDAMARLWDARTGRPLTESLPHEAPTVEARLALDSGPQGIGGDPSDRWRQVVRSVRTLARSFSPDGKFFLTYQEATAHLHDAETGRPIGAAITHSSPITAAAIRPNGKAVLLVGRDGAARLWNTSTGAPAGETLKPPGGIRQVSFTPDGKMAVVIGPKTLLVDADTGRAIVDDRLRLRF